MSSSDYTHFSKLAFDQLFSRKAAGQEVQVMDSDGNVSLAGITGTSLTTTGTLSVTGAATLGSVTTTGAAAVGSLTVTGSTQLATSLTGVVKASSGTISASSLVNADVASSAALALSKLAALTTAKALQSNSSTGAIEASTVTNTELGYVSGVTSAIQTQLNNKQATGNYITSLTGEVTASGAGAAAATLTNSAVIAKVLTGFTSGAGVVAATDTILQAIQKLNGNQYGGTLTAKSADYTITDSDNIGTVSMTTSSTNRAVTLPTAANNTNRIISVKKVDTGTGKCTVTGTVNGVSNFVLVDQDDFVTVQSNGTDWDIIAKGIGTRTISRVKDEVGAGHGSTNTKIRRIETNITNTGNAVTRATSATNGNSYTINQDGFYSMAYSDARTGNALTLGISINSAQLTTSIDSITSANRIVFSESGAAALFGSCAVTLKLTSGDVIRPHTDGNADSTSAKVGFQIQKVGI